MSTPNSMENVTKADLLKFQQDLTKEVRTTLWRCVPEILSEFTRQEISDLQQSLQEITRQRDSMRDRSTVEKDERDALRRAAEAARLLRDICMGESIGDAFVALEKMSDALEAAKTKGFLP